MPIDLLIEMIGRPVSMKAKGCVVKRVHCEHCGEEYIYQLHRTVTSSEYAFLHIGVVAKKQSVMKKVQAKLQRALHDGVDVVGCPACGWLQRNMVSAWRKNAMKKVGVAAIVLGGLTLFLWTAYISGNLPAAVVRWAAAGTLAILVIATVYSALADCNSGANRRTRDALGLKCRAMPAAEFDALLAEGT